MRRPKRATRVKKQPQEPNNVVSEIMKQNSKRIHPLTGRIREGIMTVRAEILVGALLCLWLPLVDLADDARLVSYYREIVPIFKRSCTGCHHPAKLKGELDLTTYTAFQKGGKHGVSFVAGDPEKSRIVEEISGEEP